MSSHLLFEVLVAMHIVTGATGLVVFWVPVVGRKGGAMHARYGRVFTYMMLTTGLVAVGIACTTLSDPVGTHPHLTRDPLFSDPRLIEGIFGWMMLYLATLTVNLAWHGWLCINNRRDHAANRAWHNLLLQLLLTVASANCAWRGVALNQPLMVAISGVGFATVATNLWFPYKPRPRPLEDLPHSGHGLPLRHERRPRDLRKDDPRRPQRSAWCRSWRSRRHCGRYRWLPAWR